MPRVGGLRSEAAVFSKQFSASRSFSSAWKCCQTARTRVRTSGYVQRLLLRIALPPPSHSCCPFGQFILMIGARFLKKKLKKKPSWDQSQRQWASFFSLKVLQNALAEDGWSCVCMYPPHLSSPVSLCVCRGNVGSTRSVCVRHL